MQYSLELLGRRFQLTVPFELHICPSMIPFLSPDQENQDGLQILVRPGYVPQPDQSDVWHETCYYAYEPDLLRVLHCQSAGSAPYAMLELHQDGNIMLTYRPESEYLLRHAGDLMKHIGLERLLLHHSGVVLHASYIAKNGKGILFSAPSGTGKSTQAELWQALRGYEILNGDRAGICHAAQGWMAWGLPYAGTSGLYRNESASIGAIVVLRQGSENRISRLNRAQAVRYLYPETTVHYWEEPFILRVLDILQALTEAVPVYRLDCLPDASAVELLANTLAKEGVL